MIKLVLLLSLLLLSGCAVPQSGNGTAKPGSISLNEIITHFEADAKKYGQDFSLQDYDIRFIDLPGSQAGYCGYIIENGQGHQYIAIDSGYWNSHSDSEREALIYHELGHCVLNQVHRANSIMEPKVIKDFHVNKDYYIKELFSYEI